MSFICLSIFSKSPIARLMILRGSFHAFETSGSVLSFVFDSKKDVMMSSSRTPRCLPSTCKMMLISSRMSFASVNSLICGRTSSILISISSLSFAYSKCLSLRRCSLSELLLKSLSNLISSSPTRPTVASKKWRNRTNSAS